MKRLIVFIITILIFNVCFPQVPQSFNYQVIPRTISGSVYPEQTMSLQLSIIQGTPSGTIVYTERFTKTTTSLGLLNLQIGTGTPVSGSFSSINWSAGSFYLKVEIDVAGGTSYTDMGTTQLISVPYAMYAKEAGNGFSGSYNDLTGKPGKIGDFAGDMNNNLITNLAEPVSFNDASTKAYVDRLGNDMEDVGLSTGGLTKDYDGNIYKTVRIGNQTWLASDLKTTHFNNGDPIPTTTPSNQNITGNPSPVFQWAPQGDESNTGEYGRLYTWYAATDPRGVCPVDFHLAANEEWEEMVDFLGGASVAGEKLREAGELHWHSGNTGTDESGFSGLPGGFRAPEGPFYWFTEGAYFWTATPSSPSLAYRPAFHYDWTEIDMGSSSGKNAGHSVRCIKNNEINKTFDGTVTLAGIKLSGGSGQGKVMTSDASGTGSWQLPVGIVPMGGVIAWLKNMAGTPALPANFAECSGQVVNDPESPYNGITLPDLNNKFLMGGTESGLTGGASIHSHSGSFTNYPTDPPVSVSSGAGNNTAVSNHLHSLNMTNASNMPPYFSVVWIIRIK